MDPSAHTTIGPLRQTMTKGLASFAAWAYEVVDACQRRQELQQLGILFQTLVVPAVIVARCPTVLSRFARPWTLDRRGLLGRRSPGITSPGDRIGHPALPRLHRFGRRRRHPRSVLDRGSPLCDSG